MTVSLVGTGVTLTLEDFDASHGDLRYFTVRALQRPRQLSSPGVTYVRTVQDQGRAARLQRGPRRVPRYLSVPVSWRWSKMILSTAETASRSAYASQAISSISLLAVTVPVYSAR
jgi:hypothetical protein